ncbi:MAG TPA: DUF6069 family protein [Acidimicrobiales bacterium]|nr:DUF6069 family protein [Acidimicrobiales bacterium]
MTTSTDLASRWLPSPAPHTTTGRALGLVRYDPQPAHGQPGAPRWAAATVIALVGSVVADWVVATVTVAVVPSTSGYQHFRASDYIGLTVIGVLAACVGWPVVTRACSHPRWLFSRLAVLVSAVLLLPDVALLVQGQPVAAVVGLMVMHVAIGVVTYFALTRIAPERSDAAVTA